MSANKKSLPNAWDDDDIPELTEAWFDHAEIRGGSRVVRPATGVLTKDGIRPAGRPPVGDAPKQQVTLRLDADLIAHFRASGRGWQTRLNAALRQVAGM